MNKTIRPDQLDAVYEAVSRPAVDLFNRQGFLVPMLLSVCLQGDEAKVAGIVQIDPALIEKILSQESGKDHIMRMVSEMLDHDSSMCEAMVLRGLPKPDVAVFVAEAWMSANLFSEGGQAVAPSESPDRAECLVIELHLPDKSVLGICPIDEGPPKRCRHGALMLIEGSEVLGPMSRTQTPPRSKMH